MARIKDKISKISASATQSINPATVDLISNKEALISGCHGVIEYDEKCVKVNCGSLIIGFGGIGLSIKALSIEEIIVTGEIFKIEFTNC